MLRGADIYIYRSKVPVNFGGVLIFVDGERSPADTLQEERLGKSRVYIEVRCWFGGSTAMSTTVYEEILKSNNVEYIHNYI